MGVDAYSLRLVYRRSCRFKQIFCCPSPNISCKYFQHNTISFACIVFLKSLASWFNVSLVTVVGSADGAASVGKLERTSLVSPAGICYVHSECSFLLGVNRLGGYTFSKLASLRFMTPAQLSFEKLL